MRRPIMIKLCICYLTLLVLLNGAFPVSAESNGPTVTPSSPNQVLFLEFDQKEDANYFWSNDSTTYTVENGTLAITGTGINWGLLFASDDNYLPLEANTDYTVMLKYKTHPDTPQFQFVVHGEQYRKSVSDYCYRWGTDDFKNKWSYQRDPLTGETCNWYGDFDHIKDGEFDIVSFHFYTSPDCENLYFSLSTCGNQASHPLDFTLDSFSLFEGYAELSDPKDIVYESFKTQTTTGAITTKTTPVLSTKVSDTTISEKTQRVDMVDNQKNMSTGWIVGFVVMIVLFLFLVMGYLLFIQIKGRK